VEQPATWADLRALPEERHAEIVRGTIVEKAAPTFDHGSAQFALGESLVGPYQGGRGGPGGWWFGTEVDIELEPHEVYRPDVAGWRRDRVPERLREWPVRVRPDWVCEVLSPSNARIDLGPKLVTYHRAGVGHYWVIDPEHRTLTVYRATSEGYLVAVVGGLEDILRAPPFEAVEINVARLFGA
jgi:Uma2 family endonuclease